MPHLIGNTFRYASRCYCEQMATDLWPGSYTGATEQAAATWGAQYPAIVALGHGVCRSS